MSANVVTLRYMRYSFIHTWSCLLKLLLWSNLSIRLMSCFHWRWGRCSIEWFEHSNVTWTGLRNSHRWVTHVWVIRWLWPLCCSLKNLLETPSSICVLAIIVADNLPIRHWTLQAIRKPSVLCNSDGIQANGGQCHWISRRHIVKHQERTCSSVRSAIG